MVDSDWLPIDTAPKDGKEVDCLWPSFGQPNGRLHQGRCVFKKDWYALGKPVELETWWTGPEFKNPTARYPTHWREVG